MFSCGIATYSSTKAWRSSYIFIRFRLRTHLSQKFSIGDLIWTLRRPVENINATSCKNCFSDCSCVESSIVLLKHGNVFMFPEEWNNARSQHLIHVNVSVHVTIKKHQVCAVILTHSRPYHDRIGQSLVHIFSPIVCLSVSKS